MRLYSLICENWPKPGYCLKISGSNSSFLSITKDGPEMNCSYTPFVIVDFDPENIQLVPLNSNLPVEMTVNLPSNSNIEIELVSQGYCMDNYPQRWKEICKKYPIVKNIGR